ncbi:MAG: hypothetical protein GVY11_00160 [Gammaproteobacteria bacterium]|jgi:hypothetical protein|nr:hypothetical protein [Gammaproteobacteria bacterium]
MESPKRCPNCKTSIHPLDLSDLYRGRKLDCPACGFELRASTTGAWATAAALLAGAWPGLSSWLLQGEVLIAQLVLLAAIAALVSFAPPGLIEGAPWVGIKAQKPRAMGVRRRAEELSRAAEN